MAENRTRWSVAPMPRPGPLTPSPVPPTRGQGELGQRSCPSGSSSPPSRGRGRERGPRGGLANCPVFSGSRRGGAVGIEVRPLTQDDEERRQFVAGVAFALDARF